MISNSTNDLKSTEQPKNPVYCSVNHSQLKQGVFSFEKAIEGRRYLQQRYNVYPGGFDLLIMITSRWLREGEGSTIYSLSRHNKDMCTAIGYTVRRLLDKGLLEVVGYGKSNGRIFVPTQKVLNDLTVITGELMK